MERLTNSLAQQKSVDSRGGNDFDFEHRSQDDFSWRNNNSRHHNGNGIAWQAPSPRFLVHPHMQQRAPPPSSNAIRPEEIDSDADLPSQNSIHQQNFRPRQDSFTGLSQSSIQRTFRDREASFAAHSQNSNPRFFWAESVESNYQFRDHRLRQPSAASSVDPLPTQTQSSAHSNTSDLTSPSPATRKNLKKSTVSQTTKTTGGSGSNFNKEELEQLCKSWLNVSEDAIVGNDQKSTTFWKKITDDFHD